jgi:hypothetical protein
MHPLRTTAELTAAKAAAEKASSNAAEAQVAAGKPGGTSFARLLAHAGTATTPTATTPVASTGGTATTTGTVPSATGHRPIMLREGETITKVAGHRYAEIHGGERDGMYVNTSWNARRGQAFQLVTKDGKELHVYGTGKDRLVVGVSPPRDPSVAPAPIKLRAGETMTPVPGHHYARINGGPRDGMFINTSLNAHRGQAFTRQTKDGVHYHIYGSGKDREVVRCVPVDAGEIVHTATAT